MVVMRRTNEQPLLDTARMSFLLPASGECVVMMCRHDCCCREIQTTMEQDATHFPFTHLLVALFVQRNAGVDVLSRFDAVWFCRR